MSTILEQVESSVLNAAVGRYLALLVEGYDPKEAHRIVDVTERGYCFFAHGEVLVSDHALAALLFGRNELTRVAVGRIDLECSILSFWKAPLVITVAHVHSMLTPREPTIISKDEVHAFWRALTSQMPEELLQPPDDEAPTGRSSASPIDFGSLHRIAAAVTICIHELKFAYARSAALIDMFYDVREAAERTSAAEPEQKSTRNTPTLVSSARDVEAAGTARSAEKESERKWDEPHGVAEGFKERWAAGEGDATWSEQGKRSAEPPRLEEYSFFRCCCCLIGTRRAAAQRQSGSQLLRSSTDEVAPQQTAPLAPAAESPQQSSAPPSERSITASLLLERSSDDAWGRQLRYANATYELRVTGLRISNADASFGHDEPPLSAIAQPRADGTVAVHKRVSIESVALRIVNQYGVASSLNTPLRLEVRLTARIAIKGCRLIGTESEVVLPESVGLSAPLGQTVGQAIIAFARDALVGALSIPADPEVPPVHTVRVHVRPENPAGHRRAVERALGEDARTHVAAMRMDKGHARVRRSLAELGLDTKAGVTRFVELFRQMDDDQDGKGKALEYPEFRRLLSSFGATLDDHAFNEVVALVDADCNGLVDVAEFLRAFGFELPEGVALQLRPTPRLTEAEAPAVAEAEDTQESSGCVVS